MVNVLEIAPDPEAPPVQPEKTYWVPSPPGTMLDDTIAWAMPPLLYHPEPVTVPCPPLLTFK